MVFGNRNFAAAVPFTRVLAGAAVVTGLATTLPLAVVLAFATVLGRRRAASLAFAVVHALAHMLLAAFGCLFFRNYSPNLRAGKNPGHSAEQ